MESIGKILQKLRLEKGLSLEEVQKKTKIHLNILKAIEEDSFMNLSPIYIKGFLKIYCKFLGVDPKNYISDYKTAQTTISVSDTETKPLSFIKTASVKLRSFKAINKRLKGIFIIILIFIFSSIALFNLGKVISYRRRSLSREDKLPAPILDKTRKKKIQTAQSQKMQSLAIKSRSKQPESTSGKPATFGIKLSILARDDCWITLKMDGRLVFHGILKKGKSESWQAKEKIEFSLSNAGAVDLILNGERISSLGKRGQARKNILITKEGLTIP